MLIEYVALGILKAALVVFLPGYAFGAAAAFAPEKSRRIWAAVFLAAFFAVFEAAVFIDKGLPFFFGNLYNMISGYPRLPIHFVVGALLDGAWVYYTCRKADSFARKIASRRAIRSAGAA